MNTLIHYFNDLNLDKIEYNPSTLEMFVTFASGKTTKLTNVLTETFYSFSNSENPYQYFDEVILNDNRIGRN